MAAFVSIQSDSFLHTNIFENPTFSKFKLKVYAMLLQFFLYDNTFVETFPHLGYDCSSMVKKEDLPFVPKFLPWDMNNKSSNF